METELAATVDEVWDAISSGPGVNCWFMGHTDIEPRLGGTVRSVLGQFAQESVITAWNPREHFGYRGPSRPDGSFLALEWMIEARSGGGVSLRCVGSGFIGSDDWEDEYESLRGGGAFYFHNLAQYLTYFAGRTSTTVCAMCPTTDDMAQTRTRITLGLGIPDTVAEGDHVRLTPAAITPIDGIADYVTPQFLGVRSLDGLFRFYYGHGGVMMVEHHLFSADVESGSEQAWQTWISQLSH